MQTHHQLDARGLNCPLPILRAKKALNNLAQGEVLEVLATDPGSIKDFDSFCQQTGHQLIESNQEEKRFLFLIKKS